MPAATLMTMGKNDDSAPIAVLCVGHVDRFYPEPMLQTEGWDTRRPLSGMVYEDTWGRPAAVSDGMPERVSGNGVPTLCR